MSHLRLQTSKLFYGKYPYKISTVVFGAWFIQRNRKHGNKWQINAYNPRHWFANQISDIDQNERRCLTLYIDIMNTFLDKHIKVRISGSIIDIYLDDYQNYQAIVKELGSFVTSVSEPDSADELTTLLSSTKIILRTHYPRDIYQYKVILNRCPAAARVPLASWISQYSTDTVYMPDGTRDYLNNIKTHWGDYYIYVKDSSMVTMISLVAAAHIKRIDQYVLRSSINISI